ncbi:neprilysin-11-like [Paramacrobiotus metropolitanus]|uniref:neprilysin-11-like n=1 Tax=Paramacrobiotus metropolitanus TaxID=2943436 RepID=UPI002445D7CD|nr:neprilysin-11-like [Paramacrobiotus metropolitanus]
MDPVDTKMSPDANSSTCLTTACVRKGKEMLSYMNLTTDPCQDFYEYACGRYGENHKMKPDQTSTTRFGDQNEKLLKEKRYALRKNGVQPVVDILQKTIGGWPILAPNWDPDAFDLWKALIYLAQYGSEPLLSMSVVVDEHNSSINRLSIGIPMGLGSVATKYLATYPSFMLNVTRIFANMSTMNSDSASRYNWTDIQMHLNKTMDFLTFLTDIYPTSSEVNENFYNLRTLANVSSSLFFRSDFSDGLTDFIRASLTFAGMGHLVNENMVVNVQKPAALVALDKKMAEIEKLGVEGKRFQANLLGWMIVARYSWDLAPSLFDTFDRQGRILSGKNKTDPLWKRCIGIVEAWLPLAVASFYVDKILDKHVKQKVSDMARNIRTAFAKRLNSAEWMDTKTRARALEKLHGMLEFIAYPEFYAHNISLIEEMYGNVTVGEGWFNTLLELNRDNKIRQTQRLENSNTREYILDRLYTVTVNAAYRPRYNIIAIFAGFTQPPFFDGGLPEYCNYGSLGHVIGHEMTHGFDDQGSKFNVAGNMINWWSNSSRMTFDSKASLIVEQYSQYKTPSGNVNGNQTLSENIADAGGLRTAFDNWCGMESDLMAGSHAPDRWRVNGEMATFREFAQAYNCPADSPMVYNRSTGLWR